MKKDVCSLFEHGVYYNVYERDGFYIKENMETNEEEIISEHEYEVYKIASFLNDRLLAKKGISNDYYSEDEYSKEAPIVEEEFSVKDNLNDDYLIDSVTENEEDELDFLDAVKASVQEENSDFDEDERVLQELEEKIQANLPKNSKTFDDDGISGVLDSGFALSGENDPDILDEFALLGLLGDEDYDEEEVPIDEEIEDLVKEKDEKKGFFSKIISSRKPKEKKVRVRIPKVKKEKKVKEEKESIINKVLSSRKTKIKKERTPKEKVPKVKKEKQPKEKGESFFHKVLSSRKPKEKKIKEKRPKEHKVKSARVYSKTDKFCRNLTIFAAFALAGAIAFSAGYKNYKANRDSVISFEFNEEDSRMDTIKNTFAHVIAENKTISLDVKMELISYLEVLFSYELSSDTYNLIINNLNDYDFTGVSSIGVMEIKNLLEGNQNALAIAYELYNYKNDISYLNITKYQWISDVLSFSDEATVLFLEGEDINNILNAAFGVEESIDITSTTMKKDECNNLKAFIESLKSKVFGSVMPCELENNIFNSYIKIYDGETKCYLYYDKTTRKGISEQVYREKLDTMLNTRIDELDYTNVRDRELLYFYANALLDSNNTSTDMTEFIMSGFSSGLGVFDIFDLMRYMSDSEVNHLKAAYLYGLISYGEDAIPLLQEINMCLKMDVEEGLIKQETYDAFLHHLNLGLDAYAPYMKDKFMEANDKNEHMEGYKLKIFGGYDI